MSASPDIKLTIAFKGDALKAEARDRDALRLMAGLKDLDGVNAVRRGSAEPVPSLSKGVGSFVVGVVTSSRR